MISNTFTWLGGLMIMAAIAWFIGLTILGAQDQLVDQMVAGRKVTAVKLLAKSTYDFHLVGIMRLAWAGLLLGRPVAGMTDTLALAALWLSVEVVRAKSRRLD